MEKIILGIWTVILWIQTIYDVKWKRIPLVVTVLGAIAGLLYCLILRREWTDVLWAMTPGICCLIYSKISNEALGLGDSMLLCAMGFVFDIEHILLISLIAFGLAGIGGLVIVVFFHKKRNYEMPFVPFLLVAYLMDVAIQIGENYG